MDVHYWIIGQILIDLIMAGLLLWFFLFQYKRKHLGQKFEEAFDKSEMILSEMKQISLSLEKNLEEKQKISRSILNQLDEKIKKVDESQLKIQNIIQEYNMSISAQSNPTHQNGTTESTIHSLLEKGLSKREIAQYLGISLGEIDLMLKLQAQSTQQIDA